MLKVIINHCVLFMFYGYILISDFVLKWLLLVWCVCVVIVVVVVVVVVLFSLLSVSRHILIVFLSVYLHLAEV